MRKSRAALFSAETSKPTTRMSAKLPEAGRARHRAGDAQQRWLAIRTLTGRTMPGATSVEPGIAMA
ncbi:hypothetical protein B5K10_32165 [Rhizobium leguminosarum bv. trifolii]|uniref:Uncharacterized protein n=1 Tax=Rhizobium leguminosarum bv. trifolii TaxID=386 RepID=A0A3E1AYU9_RHILT|nr:hypothetical protein [Rhizobium leguminosarum]RFB82353.1 hypothetical protein B5K10_32165 [Rhizobium leguminosarum bv. trifolii]